MPSLRQRIAQVIDQPFPFVTLTDREAEVLRLASRGWGSVTIGEALAIPERTAYRTLATCLEKLAAYYGHPVDREDLPGLVLGRIEAIVSRSEAPTPPLQEVKKP